MSFALLRYAVFVVFLVSAALGLGAWALRTRRVNPFSAAGQTLRRVTDPVITPLERWLVRRGGNPHAAPWWLMGLALVGGILVITLVQALAFQLARVAAASRGGPRGVLRLVVYYTGQLVLLALVVRVIASWFGAFRYSRWMRPVYVLTDWVVEPLRRVIPPLGMIDVTPIVAWLVIQLLLAFVMRLL
ncbi:MAG TPA: YggT family protein [Gemmatimonadales bacterium]